MAAEMFKSENRLRSPKLFLTLLSYLDTNLSSKDTLGLCLGLRAAHESGQVSMATLPGYDMMVDGIYYWKPDEDRMKKFVNKNMIEEEDKFLSLNNINGTYQK